MTTYSLLENSSQRETLFVPALKSIVQRERDSRKRSARTGMIAIGNNIYPLPIKYNLTLVILTARIRNSLRKFGTDFSQRASRYQVSKNLDRSRFDVAAIKRHENNKTLLA